MLCVSVKLRHIQPAAAGIGRLFGYVACACQRPLGSNGAEYLVYENGKKDNKAHS